MDITVEPIAAGDIPQAWPVLLQILAPAIAFDANVTPDDVRAKLVSGQCEAAIVTCAGAQGVIVTEISEIDGIAVCWASYVAGFLRARPKAWVATMREIMGHFEDIARRARCQEMRIGGRDWSRILPGYEPIGGGPNHMRKRL